MERNNFKDRMLVPTFQCTYSETVQMYSAVPSLRYLAEASELFSLSFTSDGIISQYVGMRRNEDYG
jgi:hypothetical protein